MSSVSAGPASFGSRSLAFKGPLGWQALTLGMLCVGLAVSLLMPPPDVSWLLIVGERVLHGQRLYSQVLETNPPFSVMLYEPAVLVADWSGVKPETAVAGLLLLGVLTSLGFTGALLRPLIGDDPTCRWKLTAAAAFVLCVLPVTAYGQREHIAVMALLPFVALQVLRGERQPTHWSLAVLAGIGLGVAAAIKPHFAAIGVLPALWAMWRSRSFRPWALPELWAASLVFASYVASVLVFYPDYLPAFMPVLRDVYLAIRIPLWQIMILPPIPLAAASFIIARLIRLEGRWLAAPMLAALGGGLAFVVQGKGWLYHAYPMLAFATLGVLAAAIMTPSSRAQAWSRIDRAMMLAPALAAVYWLATVRVPGPAPELVASLAPPSPSVASVTGDLCIGIPLVSSIGAHWAESAHSDWIAEGAMAREEVEKLDPATRARLDRLVAQDRTRLAHDLAANRPDVILFDRKKFDWRAWALEDPTIAAVLTGYRLAGVAKHVEIWTRVRS